MSWFWKRKPKSEVKILSITYDMTRELLTLGFSDESRAVHDGVKHGYVVGLQIAADKLDFYETCIRHAFPLIDPPQDLPERQTKVG